MSNDPLDDKPDTDWKTALLIIAVFIIATLVGISLALFL